MISCEDLFEAFEKNDLTFFTGVPDSTFKEWMNFLADENGIKLTNIIASNECEATAIASGFHLSTKKTGVVYLQNSGEGKTVNPLVSLCDKEIYSIPLIMIIGWRGEPGIQDEPQHKKMGKITLPLLDLLGIPYFVLPDNIDSATKIISKAKMQAHKTSSPVALIIRKNTLEPYSQRKKEVSSYGLSREEVLKDILVNLNEEDIIISTTGKTSRELFEARVSRQERPRDFYTVGSMGCSASIALGIALQKSERRVFVLDGDGAVIMQMGALATIGHYKPKNFHHIIFDNQSYESTGKQPTVSSTLDFSKIALSCGYASTQTLETKKEFEDYLKNIGKQEGPSMVVIKINSSSREGLGRPTSTPLENKEFFMEHLEK